MLPVRCVLTDEIPRNMTGKVDIHKILDEDVQGFRYKIEGVYENEKLREIKLIPEDPRQNAFACDEVK